MAQTPRKPQQPTPAGPERPLTRRGRARWQRERDRQRLVYIISGTAIGLALLAIVAGLLFEQVWKPSRPVAQVGQASLTTGGYWTERRNEIARNIAQNVQLVSLFGSQFSEQFAGQTASLEAQVPGIRSAAVDESTINGWIERQVILQSAERAYNIKASDGEVAQQLVADLASAFPPPPPPPTTTTTLTPTATLSTTAVAPTTTLTPTATVISTTIPATVTPGGPTETLAPTETLGPTETPAPTETPTATPGPDTAIQQRDEIIGRLFDAYVRELTGGGGAVRQQLTIDDFKAALYDQYLQRVTVEKIKAQLVPEAGFTPTTDPSSITARHILIKSTVPVTATEAERNTALAALRPQAQAILDELRGGADFATLARERSEDLTTRENGGELPSFDKDGKTPDGTQVDPAFAQAALALQEGDYSELVQTPFGWHIIQVTTRTIPSTQEQLEQERTKAYDEWIAKQRAELTAERFPPVSPSPTSPPTGTALPLPTVPLGGEPTAVPTSTTTLTDTTLLTPTAPLATPSATTTAIPTGTPSPLAGTATAPTAVLPTQPGAATPTSRPTP